MKYVIACATPVNFREFEKRPLYKSLRKLKKLKPNLIVEIDFDNNRGLSIFYNEIIEKYKNEKIIFVHDDVVIEDMFIFQKLDEAFKTNDIVGLAGSESINLDLSHISWFNSVSAKDGSLSGMVFHFDKEKHISFPSYYGPFGKNLMAIDGLFIAINSKTINHHKVKFDDKLKFHFYDLDFCLSAKYKHLKITTAPIYVTHYSLGYGIFDNLYKEMQTIFLKKWKDN